MQIIKFHMKLQIEAYGKTKERVETNGSIERGHRSEIHQSRRNPRSIEEEMKRDGVKKEVEDLEGQDSKVFRPLFVYRQQVARRNHWVKNYAFPVGVKVSCENRALIFWAEISFDSYPLRFDRLEIGCTCRDKGLIKRRNVGIIGWEKWMFARTTKSLKSTNYHNN